MDDDGFSRPSPTSSSTSGLLSTNSAHAHAGGDCANNMMVWNWATDQLCVIFNWWKVNSTGTMIATLVFIFLVSLMFEYLMNFRKVVEGEFGRDVSLLSVNKYDRRTVFLRKAYRSGLYALQALMGYYLMQVFMMLNGYFVMTILLGAFVGHMMFSEVNPSGSSIGIHERC